MFCFHTQYAGLHFVARAKVYILWILCFDIRTATTIIIAVWLLLCGGVCSARRTGLSAMRFVICVLVSAVNGHVVWREIKGMSICAHHHFCL
jgi:hypothetical protein